MIYKDNNISERRTKTVREDKERSLKTQEEINVILGEKLSNRNTDKNNG